MHTPLIVDTSTSFERYIERLSKSSKKNYKATVKRTREYKFSETPYNNVLMYAFIKLWERQIVYGSHPRWSLSMWEMDSLGLTMFKIEKDGIVAIHAIEKCDDYAYAHPPLYDKHTPELARYIWFNTIKWCCDHDVNNLDLGGLSGRDWPTLIRQRHDKSLMRLRYKWSYVPKDVKDNPDSQQSYYQLRCGCGWKQLSLTKNSLCNRCTRER